MLNMLGIWFFPCVDRLDLLDVFGVFPSRVESRVARELPAVGKQLVSRLHALSSIQPVHAAVACRRSSLVMRITMASKQVLGITWYNHGITWYNQIITWLVTWNNQVAVVTMLVTMLPLGE